jgi:3-phenylpropionate/trans-cinnamate dioxygenase ferredoxin subunit
MSQTTFVAIADATDVPAGEARVVTYNGWRYAVCNVDGTFHVVDDTCTHDDGPLGEGQLDGCDIVCPRHGARFDVRDGSVQSMPAVYPVRAYETRVQDGKVEIALSRREVAEGNPS